MATSNDGIRTATFTPDETKNTTTVASHHNIVKHPQQQRTKSPGATRVGDTSDKKVEDKYASHTSILTFENAKIESTFYKHYVETMYYRRWIFLLLIIFGLLILIISIDKYNLIYERGTTAHALFSLLCVLLYATGRCSMAGLMCTNPKLKLRKYNFLRRTAGVAIILVHTWMIIIINPEAEQTQGVKLPVVQAFAALGELLFLGFRFVWMLPAIGILSINLIIWEFRCNTPVFGIMIGKFDGYLGRIMLDMCCYLLFGLLKSVIFLVLLVLLVL